MRSAGVLRPIQPKTLTHRSDAEHSPQRPPIRAEPRLARISRNPRNRKPPKPKPFSERVAVHEANNKTRFHKPGSASLTTPLPSNTPPQSASLNHTDDGRGGLSAGRGATNEAGSIAAAVTGQESTQDAAR